MVDALTLQRLSIQRRRTLRYAVIGSIGLLAAAIGLGVHMSQGAKESNGTRGGTSGADSVGRDAPISFVPASSNAPNVVQQIGKTMTPSFAPFAPFGEKQAFAPSLENQVQDDPPYPATLISWLYSPTPPPTKVEATPSPLQTSVTNPVTVQPAPSPMPLFVPVSTAPVPVVAVAPVSDAPVPVPAVSSLTTRMTTIPTARPGLAPFVLFRATDYTSAEGVTVSEKFDGARWKSYVDFGSMGSWIEFKEVQVPHTGLYDIKLRYANGALSNRPAQVYANNFSEMSEDFAVDFAHTTSWTNWEIAKTAKPIFLLGNQGNKIRIVITSNTGGPNLDTVRLIYAGFDGNEETSVFDDTSATADERESDGQDPVVATRPPAEAPGISPPMTNEPTKRPSTRPTPSPTRAQPTTLPTNFPTEKPKNSIPVNSQFTLALYPDLQKLTKDRVETEGLDEITKYIISQKDRMNIKMVLSVGDMVNVAQTCNEQSRWDRVLSNVRRLDNNGISFVPTCGNHDGCFREYGTPEDYVDQFTNDRNCGRKP